MANFNQHLSGGAIAAVIGTAISIFFFSVSFVQAVVTFIFIIFGAILPDIDSDTSKPVHMAFGAAGIILPVITYQFFFHGEYKLENLLCYIVFGYLIIRYAVANIFFKFTHHRGIIHSIPFAVICGEVTYLLFINSATEIRLLFAFACTAGVLVHLAMDEIWSIDASGLRIKSSFGSALALKSKSITATSLFYLLIIILAVLISVFK